MQHRVLKLVWLMTVVALAGHGCGEGSLIMAPTPIPAPTPAPVPAPTPAPVPISLSLFGVNIIAVGISGQLEAVVTFSDNTTVCCKSDITGVQWTSSDPSIARVSPGGVATGVAPGVADAIATLLTLSATIPVFVNPASP